MEDAPIAVEALHGRQRPACVAPLTLVVILKDPGINLSSVIEEREPSRHTHLDPQRVLAGWRNIYEPRLRLRPLASENRQSLSIDFDRD